MPRTQSATQILSRPCVLGNTKLKAREGGSFNRFEINGPKKLLIARVPNGKALAAKVDTTLLDIFLSVPIEQRGKVFSKLLRDPRCHGAAIDYEKVFADQLARRQQFQELKALRDHLSESAEQITEQMKQIARGDASSYIAGEGNNDA